MQRTSLLVDLCPEARKFKIKDHASGQDWLAVSPYGVRPNGQEKGRQRKGLKEKPLAITVST